MTKTGHRIYLSFLVAIVFIAFISLAYFGLNYYKLGTEERVYDKLHSLLKPSGTIGHGLGIVGTFLIIFGVSMYMAKKRYRFLSRMGLLKHWLEFHIFLCTLGPILVLYHTSFKFGGLVAISFWSMVAVFLSGIAGRFIYLQIPHSIEGRELTLNEVRNMKKDILSELKDSFHLDDINLGLLSETLKKRPGVYNSNAIIRYVRSYSADRSTVFRVRSLLRMTSLPRSDKQIIMHLIEEDIKLNRRIERLDTMQSMFKYWHVIHSPFALVMLIIMVIHVAVTIVFGYRWIF
jgi:hypothetical protein